MSIRGVVNQLAMPDVHASMRDVIRSAAEEQKVAGAQMLAIDSNNSAPGSLQIGITRHIDSATAHQHLGKA